VSTPRDFRVLATTTDEEFSEAAELGGRVADPEVEVFN
jgi:hypothetical protein